MPFLDGLKRNAVIKESLRLVKHYAPQFGLKLVDEVKFTQQVLALYDAKETPR